MKLYNTILAVFAALLTLLCLSEAAPSSGLEQRSIGTVEMHLAALFGKIKDTNKKYNDTEKITITDIKSYSKEITGLVTNFTAECSDSTWDLLDLNGLCKILTDLLCEINYTLAQLWKKGVGLTGLDGIFALLLQLLCGDLVTALLKLIACLLKITLGTGDLLGILGPLLNMNGLGLSSILGLLGLLKIFGKGG